MPKQIYFCLFAIGLLVACKPAAEAKPLDATEMPAATANQPQMNEAAVELVRRGPKGMTRDYFACLDSATGTIENAQCLSEEAKRQDARLNSIYKKLAESLDPRHKKLLVEAQREWLILRDKDGVFEASLFDSSQAENLSAAEREIFYTCERADLLQDWLDLVSD
ncbi:lysozyme inhibitor LprI family protein [Lysobacter yangpyeongensis]|uniref:Lysozyme inhibitor LprI family protein n=1 Tax=Lysobacter yangpyeongensis TaxID=346182 RepID=A0ABW0SR94_9GAMM